MARPQWKRVNGIMYVSVLIIATLVLRLAYLQVIQGEHHAALAKRNMNRVVSTAAPRGLFLDRNGNVLVTNQFRYDVGMRIDPREPWQEDTYEELADFFVEEGIWTRGHDGECNGEICGEECDVQRKLNSAKLHRRYQDIFILETNISKEMMLILEENSWKYPHMEIVRTPVRDYVEGSIFPQLFGMNSDGTPRGFTLEQTWNDYLQGIDGKEIWAVNVNSVPLELLDFEEAVPGDNLVLTIDLELQKYVQDVLREGMEEIQTSQISRRINPARHGAAIVIDVRTGEILAMASYPDYDVPSSNEIGQLMEHFAEIDAQFNRGFSRNVTTSYELFRPMVANHGIGSTAKILTSIIALEEGVITPNQRYHDTGSYVPRHDTEKRNPIPNFNGRVYGGVNLRDAFQVSLNTYFAWMMDNLSSPYSNNQNMRIIEEYTDLFGLTGDTGFTDVEGRNRTGSLWGGQKDAARFPLGSQSVINVSPLHMANLVSMVANRGYHYQPRLVKEIMDHEGNVVEAFEPEVYRSIPDDVISDSTYDAVIDAMDSATKFSPRTGTSAWAFNGVPYEVAAKTGTADAGRGVEAHSWWVGFAPIEEPEIAVVIFTEHSGNTGVTSASARKIMDQYFGLNDKDNDE